MKKGCPCSICKQENAEALAEAWRAGADFTNGRDYTPAELEEANPYT